MPLYQTPGIYREDVFLTPTAELRTGVPAFLGYAEKGQFNSPHMLTLWPQFEQVFGLPHSYLANAVLGFFENGGSLCYIIRLDPSGSTKAEALAQGLEAIASLDTIDLVCTPDIFQLRALKQLSPLDEPPPLWADYIRRLFIQQGVTLDVVEVLRLQTAVLDHCDALGDRFAILDSLPGAQEDETLIQRRALNGLNGALYYPWIRAPGGPALSGGFVPPCGHVAGVYARTDARTGVHKAPANEALEGVLDLEVNLSDAEQGKLNPSGVNCLRTFPGRGIRVWGARTLSNDPAWQYINARRLFLTAGRWIERNMADVVYEANDAGLWARIRRELTAYFNNLFRRGALKGRAPQEAFYVKCDLETNPPQVRDAGQLVTEIGLAPAAPNEFVVVRIIHGPGGVAIVGPG